MPRTSNTSSATSRCVKRYATQATSGSNSRSAGYRNSAGGRHQTKMITAKNVAARKEKTASAQRVWSQSGQPRADREYDWHNYQNAAGIAEPPRPPSSEGAGPRHCAPQTQTGDANRTSDQAHRKGDADKGQRLLESIERIAVAQEPAEQCRAKQSLQQRAGRIDPNPCCRKENTANAFVCGIAAQLLARNAPSQIPGQMRFPKISSAATAIPEGGQTTVAIPGGGAAVRPSRPVR